MSDQMFVYTHNGAQSEENQGRELAKAPEELLAHIANGSDPGMFKFESPKHYVGKKGDGGY
jgi:hypothetical protein